MKVWGVETLPSGSHQVRLPACSENVNRSNSHTGKQFFFQLCSKYGSRCPQYSSICRIFHSSKKENFDQHRMRELNVEHERKRLVRYRTDSQSTRWLVAIILVLEHHWCCKIWKNNPGPFISVISECAHRDFMWKWKYFLCNTILQLTNIHHLITSSSFLWINFEFFVLACGSILLLSFSSAGDSPSSTAPSSGLPNIEQTHIWSRITNTGIYKEGVIMNQPELSQRINSQLWKELSWIKIVVYDETAANIAI